MALGIDTARHGIHQFPAPGSDQIEQLVELAEDQFSVGFQGGDPLTVDQHLLQVGPRVLILHVHSDEAILPDVPGWGTDHFLNADRRAELAGWDPALQICLWNFAERLASGVAKHIACGPLAAAGFVGELRR